MQSVTSLRDCPHWKANCHKCLVKELVEVLEQRGCEVDPIDPCLEDRLTPPIGPYQKPCQTCAVLKKAKQMDDCIATEEEAAANH